MTVVTDEEVEQFRETAITDVYRHGSESATAFVTSCTLAVARKQRTMPGCGSFWEIKMSRQPLLTIFNAA